MLQFEELGLRLNGNKQALTELGEAIGIENLRSEIAKLEEQSADPNFWNDMDNSKVVLKQLSDLKNRAGAYDKLSESFDDALVLIELGNEEEDLSLLEEAQQAVEAFEKELESQKLQTLLSGEYDANNAILTFHAGAGGTEAQDWAEMLLRMYTHWAERHGYKVTTLDYLDGDEAGLKSASIQIDGLNAYGYLKCESGVHRLVRVSPFDSSGRRHTSFASIEVMPEIDDDIEVEIRQEDLRIDTYRSSGAGGQHVNTTDSAVRITHIPTGIVTTCQNERSQIQNREVAMKMLRSKLIEIKEREHLEHIEDIKGVQKEIAWGSQIRSYVFMPYTLAKDHRTGYSNGNIGAVMDGDLDGFINEYLKAQSLGKLGNFD